jgi:hypothetical protein
MHRWSNEQRRDPSICGGSESYSRLYQAKCLIEDPAKKYRGAA